MNQPDPALQGAIKVAQARLQTIDEALAKLEAMVPDGKDQNPRFNDPTPTMESTPPNPSASKVKTDDPIKAEIETDEPTPIPMPSQQALETFLAGV